MGFFFHCLTDVDIAHSSTSGRQCAPSRSRWIRKTITDQIGLFHRRLQDVPHLTDSVAAGSMGSLFRNRIPFHK